MKLFCNWECSFHLLRLTYAQPGLPISSSPHGDPSELLPPQGLSQQSQTLRWLPITFVVVLRYNSNAINNPLFKVYSSVVLNGFKACATTLLIPEHFRHLKKKETPYQIAVPSQPVTQPLPTTDLLPISMHLPILAISYKQSHRTRGLCTKLHVAAHNGTSFFPVVK